jgi:hypothetical protein
LFGRGLIDSQLRSQLVHRNVGQDVVYSTHRSAFLPAAMGSAQSNTSSTSDITAGAPTFARRWDPAG